VSVRISNNQGALQGSILTQQKSNTFPASNASGRKNIKTRQSKRRLKRLKIQTKKMLTLNL
jgi:hypothetical protein